MSTLFCICRPICRRNFENIFCVKHDDLVFWIKWNKEHFIFKLISPPLSPPSSQTVFCSAERAGASSFPRNTNLALARMCVWDVIAVLQQLPTMEKEASWIIVIIIKSHGERFSREREEGLRLDFFSLGKSSAQLKQVGVSFLISVL